MEEAKQTIGVSATLGQSMSKNYIKLNYEPECNIIDMRAVTQQEQNIELNIETKLKDDSKFNKESILTAAVWHCDNKMQQGPVIVVLKTTSICTEFRKRIKNEHAYVFDTTKGDTASTFAILNVIKAQNTAPYPVVITTE